MKANLVLVRAKKAGLLKGRLYQEGLKSDIKEPVTSAELVVFTLRYLEIKNRNNLLNNDIIKSGS